MKTINNSINLRGDVTTHEAIEIGRPGEFKLASTLGVAIALLSGCLATTAEAAFNIPTATVNPVTLAAVPVPSPLCSVATVVNAKGQILNTMNTDGTPNANCPLANQATPFTAKMLMFEEFGTKDMPTSASIDSSAKFPAPIDCQSGPNGVELDKFLNKSLNSMPTRVADEVTTPTLSTTANITGTNGFVPVPGASPWAETIEGTPGLPALAPSALDPLGTPATAATTGCVPGVTGSVADGRPGGEDFAHQRWEDFPAQKYFQSAQTGARDNGGLRNKLQMHKYNKGEFAKGGLNYIDANNDGTAGTDGLQIRIHPVLAVQNKNSVWTFDGTLPPKLLMAKYGESLIFRHYNALPIDVAANNGFGRHTISTHEHNGHNPAESDGFMHAYTHPGQFYDYHWPMVLAGHDSINIGATDAKTGAPDDNGGITQVPGDWHETMSTHWFHDHMLDYTAQNVYKGNAAMMNYYSAIDRGREPVNLQEATTGVKSSSVGSSVNPGYACHYANPDNANLCLPSGSGLDWGNRDYDVNLVIADKAWDAAGQLKFNIFNTDGFLGDRMTVNWEYKPYMDVRPRRYRFRMLNGAVSRDIKVAVVQAVTNAKNVVTGYKKVPFHMIANDGNIMQHAIPFPNAQSPESLPEQAIAERYDIIVDFKGLEAGTKLYMVNILEHQNGTGPARILPLADVLGAPVDGVANKATYVADGVKGDPVVGKFLEFRVAVAIPGSVDYSMNPAEYLETINTTTTTNTGTVKKPVIKTTTVKVPGKQMIPNNKPTDDELKAAVHRTFEFGRSAGTDTAPWTIKTDGSAGGGLSADPTRVSAAPELSAPGKLGKVEIWHITGSNGWTHPVHVHFEEGQILKRGGVAPPIWEKYARKDVYRVGPIADSTTSVDIAIRFREFAGTYVEHCHNTQHEDHAMLLRWDLEHPGQTTRFATPIPDWNGVTYIPSVSLPTVKSGDVTAKAKFVLP